MDDYNSYHDYLQGNLRPENLHKWIEAYGRYVATEFEQATAHEDDALYDFYLGIALKDARVLQALRHLYDASCQQLVVLEPDLFRFYRIGLY